VISAFVELSGESPALGRAEAIAASEALGGRAGPAEPQFGGLVGVELPDLPSLSRLAERLALAHRVLRVLGSPGELERTISSEAAGGKTAVFRRVGSVSGTPDAGVLDAGRRYKSGGGRIDLGRPARRFWLARDSAGREWLFEERGAVDRAGAAKRRMPLLPFQRPVSLPPRLARAAANLGRIRPGDRVLDPFLGTGALLAEAGLLGARLYGIDRDAIMARGALENLTHLGLSAEALAVGDAGTVEFPDRELAFDALLTDPPYGRSSSTGGEAADLLVARVVPRWARRLTATGQIVLVVPSGAAELPSPWERRLSVPVRVHRSLTREFRVYGRAIPGRSPDSREH
jgi:tRNA (guanine10-N2)-dimethyltransferase